MFNNVDGAQVIPYISVTIQYTPGKLEIQRRENRCILRIKDARPEDEAEFMCECGAASTTCKLSVTGQSNSVNFDSF